MSKIERMIADSLLFRQEPKVRKVKSELTLKDYIKFEKELEEYREWKKSKEPKKDDKKEPKGWEAMSVFQKFAILWITVPIVLMAQFGLILKFGMILGIVR